MLNIEYITYISYIYIIFCFFVEYSCVFLTMCSSITAKSANVQPLFASFAMLLNQGHKKKRRRKGRKQRHETYVQLN